MRIRKENLKLVIIAFLMVLSLGSLSSCQKDALQDDSGTLAPDECLITFSIPENVKQEITSRSSNEWAETYIGNLFVLCFDDQRQYQSGDIISIGSNPTGTVSVSTKAIKGTKGFVVLLANSTKYTNTADLDAGMKNKTIDDINTLFLDSWSGFAQKPASLNTMGKDMPMSSIVHEYTERPKAISLDLIHSFAKLHVLYDSGIASNDKTGLFSGDTRGHSFRVMPCPKTGYTNIFRDKEEQISSPASSSDFVEPTDKVYIHIDNGLAERTFYLPEYPNEHYAKGALVDSTKWHKDRMCIILEATDGGSKTQFFRLDFCKKATDGTYEFLDIERNKHIRFLIKAVKSNGYATVEEALAAPASNIEYTIEVDRESDVVTSNGQYALCLSNDAKIIKGGKGTYDVANVRYQAAEGIDLSVLESRSSITTNLSSSLTNAKLLVNGVQIARETAAADSPKLINGSTYIQLETTENTQELDFYVYLSFGSLRDTLVVKRYPYDEKKLELNLSATDTPNTVWDKNEAKVAVSISKFSVPYRVQPSDGYTKGVIAGSFKIGTVSAAPAGNAPFSTRLSVDVVQKGLDGILTTFFTNQSTGKLTINGSLELATPILGIDKTLIAGEPDIVATAQNYIDNDQYYVAQGWSKGKDNMSVVGGPVSGSDASFVTQVTNGYKLTVPYARGNAGNYTARFAEPIPATVNLSFNSNSHSAQNMPSSVSGKINSTVMIPNNVPTVSGGRYTFVGWSETPVQGTVLYSPGDSYTMKALDNVLYAIFKQRVKLTFIDGSDGSTLAGPFYNDPGTNVDVVQRYFFEEIKKKRTTFYPWDGDIGSDPGNTRYYDNQIYRWRRDDTGDIYYRDSDGRFDMPNHDVTLRGEYFTIREFPLWNYVRTINVIGHWLNVTQPVIGDRLFIGFTTFGWNYRFHRLYYFKGQPFTLFASATPTAHTNKAVNVIYNDGTVDKTHWGTTDSFGITISNPDAHGGLKQIDIFEH